MIKVKRGTKFPVTLELVNCLDLTEDRIIAYGESVDSPEGINMANTGANILWVLVVNSYEIGIYASNKFEEHELENVYRFGDRVSSEHNIRKVIDYDKYTEQEIYR